MDPEVICFSVYIKCIFTEKSPEINISVSVGHELLLCVPYFMGQLIKSVCRFFGSIIVMQQTAAHTVFIPTAKCKSKAVGHVPVNDILHRLMAEANAVKQPQKVCLKFLVLRCITKCRYSNFGKLKRQSKGRHYIKPFKY